MGLQKYSPLRVALVALLVVAMGMIVFTSLDNLSIPFLSQSSLFSSDSGTVSQTHNAVPVSTFLSSQGMQDVALPPAIHPFDPETFTVIPIRRAIRIENNEDGIGRYDSRVQHDVTHQVYSFDDVWTEPLVAGNTLQVSFIQALTDKHDITIYARPLTDDVAIGIYTTTGERIDGFEDVRFGLNTVYLKKLFEPTVEFVLIVESGQVMLDYIVDPVADPVGALKLTAQTCTETNTQDTFTFLDSCAGLYPGSCGDGAKDRVSCNDGYNETITYDFKKVGGIRISTYNDLITDCGAITSVQLCRESWFTLSGGQEAAAECWIQVSNNVTGNIYYNISTTCPGTSANPGETCTNVTDFGFSCSNFFGATGSRAGAGILVSTTSGGSGGLLTTDALYFNVTYSPKPNITFSSPTPAAGYQSELTYFTVNASGQSEGNHSIFLDKDGDLTLWYTMDDLKEGLGGPADLSSYGRHGTATGGAYQNNASGSGPRGKSYRFDGVDDYISTGHDFTWPNTSSFTISLWFNTTSFNQHQTIFGKTGYEYSLGLYSNGQPHFIFWNTVEGEELSLTPGPGVISANQWNHLLITYNASNTTGFMYLNGAQVASDTTVTSAFQYYAENLSLGRGYLGGSTRYFNGSIDEFMIFNRAFTQSEVSALYGGSAPNYNRAFSNLSSGPHNYTAHIIDVSGGRNSDSRIYTVNSSYITSCRSLFTPNTKIVLASNLSTTGNCLFLSANNLTVDLNGYTVISDGIGGTDYGIIFNNTQNSTVGNGSIRGFANALRQITSTRSVMRNITIYGDHTVSDYGTHYPISLVSGNYTILDNILIENITSLADFVTFSAIQVGSNAREANISNIIIRNVSGGGSDEEVDTSSVRGVNVVATYTTLNNITIKNIRPTHDYDGMMGDFFGIYGTGSNLVVNNVTISDVHSGGQPTGIQFNGVSTIVANSTINTSNPFSFDFTHIGILASGSNSIVSNNVIVIHSNQSNGINIFDRNNISLVENTFTLNGTNSNGIVLTYDSDNISIEHNNFDFITSQAIFLLGHSTYYPNNLILRNNTYRNIGENAFHTGFSGINNIQFIDDEIGAYYITGNLDSVRVLKTGIGEISFRQAITGSGSNFSDHVKISQNFTEIRSDLNNGLNKSADVTFYNMPGNFVDPKILKDGVECPSNICTNQTSLNAGTVIFNVSEWSNYTIKGKDINLSITIESPINDTILDSTPDLDFTVTTNHIIDSCWYVLDSGSATPLASCNNITLAPLSSGQHNITVFANTTDTNTSNATTVWFTVYEPEFSATIESPGNITYYATSVPLEYTVVNYGIVDACWYSLNGGESNTTLPGCTNTTLTSLSEGSHTIHVYINDSYNNVNSSSVSFTINLTGLVNCRVLDSENTKYTLLNNVSNASTCFTINAENVTLDLNGYAVEASGISASYYGVYANASHNFTIENGEILNFGRGIYAVDAYDGTIRNISIATNASFASETFIYGIHLLRSIRTTVQNMTLDPVQTTGTGGLSYGIYLSSANHSILRESRINKILGGQVVIFEESSGNGIYAVSTTNLTIEHNNIGNITGLTGLSSNYLLYLNSGSDHVIRNNTISGMYDGSLQDTGVHVQDVFNSTIDSNSINTSQDSLSRGLFIFRGGSINVTGNVMRGGDVTFFFSESTQGRILNNTLYSPASTGTNLNIHSNSTFNLIENNTFPSAIQDAITFTTSGGGKYPTDNNISNNLVANVTRYGLSLTAHANRTRLIDQNILNYTFSNPGSTLVVERTNLGEIEFNTHINGSGQNLSHHIFIDDNFAEVRSDLNNDLNKSANITFYNMPGTFLVPVILKDGEECPQDVCTNQTSLNAGTVIFNVSRWSDYTVGEKNITISITVESPINDTILDSTPDLDFTVTTNHIIDSCWYVLDSGSATPLASCDNITLPPLSNAQHNITVFANTTDTNTLNSTTVWFETYEPIFSVTIESPDNITYGASSVPLEYTLYNHSKVDSCWYSTDGGSTNTSLPGCVNSTLSGLADGSHTVFVYTNDTYNNLNFSSVSFTTDTSITVTIQQPTNTTYFLDSVGLGYTATTFAPLSQCWYYLNGAGPSILPGCINISLTGLENGQYNLTVHANNTAGSEDSQTVFFEIYVANFTVTIQSPANTTYYASTIDLNYTIFNHPKVDACWYSLNGGVSNTSLPGCANSTLSGLADGSHTVFMYTNDTYNNLNFSSVSFTVDKTQLIDCGDLDMANTRYTLLNSVTATGTCFTILANNITFNGQNYTVNYASSSSGHGFSNDGYNMTTINNTRISYAGSSGQTSMNYAGILMSDARAVVLRQLTVEQANHSYGIVLMDVQDANVTLGTISNIGSYGAVINGSSSNVRVTNNDIQNFGPYGMYAGSATSGLVFTSNAVLINMSSAVSIAASDSTISGNYIETPESVGLYIGGEDNTITNNNIFVGAPIGLQVSAQNNTFTNNNIWVVGNQGILIDGSSSFSRFENTSVSATGNAVVIDASTVSMQNILFINTDFANNKALVLDRVDPAEILNLTFLNSSHLNETVSEDTADLELFRQWYVRANVTHVVNGAIDGAQVDFTNIFSALMDSSLTQADGLTTARNITAYSLIGFSRTEFNPYTLNVSKAGYLPYSNSTLNISSNQQFNVQLLLADPPAITQYAPTSTDFSILEYQSQLFSINYTNPNLDNTVTWYLNGTPVGVSTPPANMSSSYLWTGNFTADGHYNITVVIQNTNGEDSQQWLMEANDTTVGILSVSASASETTVAQGGTFSYTVNATCTGGTCSAVTLWVDPLPIDDATLPSAWLWWACVQITAGLFVIGIARKTKAQGTAEYIIIGGIVLIVTGIVAGTLTGLGTFTTQAGVNAMQGKLLAQDVAVTNHIIDTVQMRLDLKNTQRMPLRITSIEISGVAIASDQLPRVLDPGEEVRIFSTSVRGNKTGDRYSLPITIHYADVQTGALDKTADGLMLIGTIATLDGYEKGILGNSSNGIPFYIDGPDHYACGSLNQTQSCAHTFTVRASGVPGSYEFFAVGRQAGIDSGESEHIYVIIQD